MSAFFLVLVFSTNTVIGSACSLSKIFHKAHHHDSPASTNHEHANGTSHDHDHDGTHHDKGTTDDQCCSKFSIAFNLLEKSVSQNQGVPVIPFLEVVLHELYNTLALLSRHDSWSLIIPDRWRPLSTIQDLRIVIQSFQI